jgi:hypothetical protein
MHLGYVLCAHALCLLACNDRYHLARSRDMPFLARSCETGVWGTIALQHLKQECGVLGELLWWRSTGHQLSLYGMAPVRYPAGRAAGGGVGRVTSNAADGRHTLRRAQCCAPL